MHIVVYSCRALFVAPAVLGFGDTYKGNFQKLESVRAHVYIYLDM